MSMLYVNIIKLSPPSFRRRVGVKKPTYLAMVREIKKDEARRKKKSRKKNKKNAGRKPFLRIEDQLLMTLMYWREYRTQFHIGIDYGISESQVCRIIQKTENILRRVLQGKMLININRINTFRAFQLYYC